MRAIFALFLARKAILPVLEELDRRGWANKRWTTQDGRLQGGRPFDRISLRTLLGNVLYIGKVAYKGETHDGEHSPIIEDDVFEQTQGLLRSRERAARERPRNAYSTLLGGILFCASCGRVMGHTYTDRKGRRYRYYLCQTVQKGGRHRCRGRSVSAPEIERFVAAEVRRLGKDRALLAEAMKRMRPAPSPVEETALATALERLDASWDALPPREQAQVMHLVVEKATCDAGAGRLAITISPGGAVTAADAEAPGCGETKRWTGMAPSPTTQTSPGSAA